jgi:hypothetical protein
MHLYKHILIYNYHDGAGSFFHFDEQISNQYNLTMTYYTGWKESC